MLYYWRKFVLRPFVEILLSLLYSHFQFFSAIFCYGYDEKEILSLQREKFSRRKNFDCCWYLNTHIYRQFSFSTAVTVVSANFAFYRLPQWGCVEKFFAIEITSLSINFSIRFGIAKRKVFFLFWRKPQMKLWKLNYLFNIERKTTQRIFSFLSFSITLCTYNVIEVKT